MIRLETERLIIRNFTSEDWEDLAELGIRYEQTELAKYDDGPWPEDPEKYKEITRNFEKGDRFVAVILKENNKLIGLIVKTKKSGNDFEFGYNFHTDYQGRGYASESCKVILDYMFDTLNAELVTAGTAKVNEASNKLLKRLGFKREGEKKISFRKDDEGNPVEFIGVDYILSKKEK